jgi:hypothetical protein
VHDHGLTKVYSKLDPHILGEEEALRAKIQPCAGSPAQRSLLMPISAYIREFGLR